MMPLQTTMKKESDPLEVLREVRNMLEKRGRNLEKKKNKLDVYKVKSDKGEKLNEDQTKAVERLDGVQKQIEIVNEIQNTFASALDMCEKTGKKKEKRDRYERERLDALNFGRLTEIQIMLQEIEDIREYFSTGQHGTVCLSENELEVLDELYKKLNPSRAVGETGAAFVERTKQTGEFIVNLLEGRDRPSGLGTTGSKDGESDATEEGVTSSMTYKDVKELVDKILQCEYFTGPKIVIENEEEEVEEAEGDKDESSDVPEIVQCDAADTRSTNLVNGGTEVIPDNCAPVEAFSETIESEETGTNGNEVDEEEAQPVVQPRPHASWSEVAAADGDKKTSGGLSDMINHLSSNYTFLVESRLDSTTPTNANNLSQPELSESQAQSQVIAPKAVPTASAPIPVPAKKSTWADETEIAASGSWADEPLPSFDAHSPAAAPVQTETRSHAPEVDIFASASQSDYLQSGGDDGEDGGGSWQQQHPRSSGHRGSGGRGGFRRDRERGSGGPRGFRGSRGGGYRGRGGGNWNSDRGSGNERSWGGRGGGGGGYRGGGGGPYRGGGSGNYRGYRTNFEYSAASGGSNF